ncbi:HD domain-containing phosphohydrolase [Deinococcus arcticus]|uniref:HD-GYP domain-containing protein n=1 Tax=Deinococcus arcticus TaxID=2136176 RepID=A0A2T3WCS5_9DEIO|nr:HD domain-containing phosphohydrolase [Deinococcus arcticus]PTA69701.1 hypothetical protein C8263_01405 [Deinococcus arcticus]
MLIDSNPAAAVQWLEGPEAHTLDEGRRALWLGRALYAAGDLPAAAGHFAAAVSGFAAQRQTEELAEAQLSLGRTFLALGDLEGAHSALLNAVELAAQLGLPELQATALNQLAAVSYQRGEPAQTLRYLHQSLDLRTRIQDVTGQVHCLTNIGTQHTRLGHYKEALEHLNQAYLLTKTLPDNPALEGPILINLAQVHHMSGSHQLAFEVMRDASRVVHEGQDAQQKAISALNLGVYALEVGALDEAREHLEAALAQSRALGFRMGEISALDSLGTLAERTGAPHEAQAAYATSLALALDMGSAQGQVDARLNLGRLHLRAGQLDAAQAQLLQAEELAVHAELPKEQILAAEALMSLHEQRGDLQQALTYAHTLRGLERQRFDTERERETRQLSIQFEVERAQQDARLYQMRTAMEQSAREAAEQEVRERTAELARAQHEVVTRLAMAAEYRDDTTGEHTRRVGRAAARIAHALGWPEAQASVLGVAARLHDVGKIGIPDRILLKKGRLSPAEYRQMQHHTLIGGRILSGGHSALLRLAEEIARSHHERWDGSGYPLGLQGEAIPLPGRIVAVADVFDALIQSRPYKAAWTLEQALQELEAQAGRQFDPQIVAVALRVLPQVDAAPFFNADHELLLAEEDVSPVLGVFEQLLAERIARLPIHHEPDPETD